MKTTKSTPNKIKAKLGLHGVSDTDTVQALMLAYDGLLNNPKFPTPPVDLPTYKAGIDRFSALIIDAEDGGKKAKSAKDKQRSLVILCSREHKITYVLLIVMLRSRRMAREMYLRRALLHRARRFFLSRRTLHKPELRGT